jgi:hypothetical protein
MKIQPHRDANTTTLFVVGSTIGEALIPIAIGQLIGLFGSKAFPPSIFCTQVILVVLYALVHTLGIQVLPSFQCWLQEIFLCDSNSSSEKITRMGFIQIQLQFVSDFLSLNIARSKAYCGFNSLQKHQRVRFNPVLDVCRLTSNNDTSFEDSVISEDVNGVCSSSKGFEMHSIIAMEEDNIFSSCEESFE